MDRRSALRGLGILAATAALESCAAKHVTRGAIATPPSPLLKLAKVNVAPEREIRTVVGLRPYRPSGFVVSAQKLDEKLMVHNYGHGGGGVTLSWGTGELACREVDASGEKNIAVLGCGAVGLATARLLQERGCTVTIYAKDLPPNTTSNIAGAQWSPVYVFDHERVAPGFMPRFVEASHIANRRYQLMVGPRYGIHWLPNFMMSDEPITAGGLRTPDSPLHDLFAETHYLDKSENPFPFPFVLQFDTMLIEPNRYLPAVMDDFHLAGGHIVVREFRDIAALQSIPERVIVNCTGLGAKALFGDDELTPIKGQLTVLLPQPEIDYCTLAAEVYMFPRTDGILLGGTHERGVWSLEPNLEAKQRILAEHARIFQQMR
ncbi:MAG TPA: FAD-dependent oxidoreductase [Terriglobales bacterium]|nr:FAD-dependent oxidoreductase [Terriglobales bacterium]